MSRGRRRAASPGRRRSAIARRSRPAIPRRFRAVTSDSWYTLVYLRSADRRELERRRLASWTDPLVRAGLSRPRAIREVRAMWHWARALEAQGRSATVAEQARRVRAATGVRWDVDAMTEGLDRALVNARVRSAPGVDRALAELRRQGRRLAVVSNVLYETALASRTVLDRLGLAEHFGFLYFSSEHAWCKPAAQPFRIALDALRARPGEAAHVGDLGFDITGARAAGLAPVLYTGLHRWEQFPAGQRPPKRLDGLRRARTWSEVVAVLDEPERRSAVVG